MKKLFWFHKMAQKLILRDKSPKWKNNAGVKTGKCGSSLLKKFIKIIIMYINWAYEIILIILLL